MMSKNNNTIPPTVLIILDGFGLDDFENEGNAIKPETAPNIFYYFDNYPSTKLKAHGEAVGLFKGQAGNSEAGHFNIGAGRVVKQDLVRISDAIEDGSFFGNLAFKKGIKNAQENNSAVHVMGLLTDKDSPHAKREHLYAILRLLRDHDQDEVYLHLFTDGRDSPPKSSLKNLKKLKNHMNDNEKIATITGRFYAMDRNKNWERTQAAYRNMVLAEGEFTAENAEEAIKEAWERGETDEYIKPTVITNNDESVAKIENEDTVVFFNARSDRARQLTKVFAQDDFLDDNPTAKPRKKVLKDITFVALTDFGPELEKIHCAFPSPDIPNCLAKAIDENRNQLYISETEKYAHATFFLNGGYPKPINGEEREMIRSDDSYSFAENPEMEAEQITDRVLDHIKNKRYNFICLNYPNADMVGHTGNIEASKKAVSIVDSNVKKVIDSVLQKNGTIIITADHGNAEEMIDNKTGEIRTEHTLNPVPFIIVDDKLEDNVKLKQGKLADIAPTILNLMKIEPPEEMTGKVLFKNK